MNKRELFLALVSISFGTTMLYTAVLQTKPINNCNVDTKNIEEMKVATESKYINPQLGDILIQVDEESKRRRSPYYGLKYKHTYGLPLSHFNLRSFRNNLTDWNHFFPELTNALNSFAKINPSHDELAFTSPNTTVIVIEGNRSRYMTGDTFKATIYAKDRLGRPKEFGGDFFRARLLSNTGAIIPRDGIPCVIIDHWNGSYSITAPLVQAAVFTLEVVLVSSFEATSRLIQFTATNREIGRVYLAELESGEKVHCNVDMSAYPIYRNTETCDYSNPRNQEPWFCIKPPSGVCSRIINIVFSEMSDEEPIHNFAAILKSKYETMSVIKGSGVKLLVLPQESADVSSLGDCVVKNHKHVRPNGYMWGGRWVSLTCANTLLAVRDTRRCLENKVVYFFGDSTIRMYSFLLGERLNLRSVGPESYYIWQNPKTIYSFGLNITTYYRAHGPPLQNPGGPETRPYISDSLDGIRVAGKDTFIIFNIGAHLHKFHPSIFIHRMQGIRDAVLRLLSRFPETRIIYRGLSVLSTPLEWYFYRYDVIVRDIFKDIENFMFLDFWDLTTVVPQNGYHPPGYLTELKSLVLFDYLCS